MVVCQRGGRQDLTLKATMPVGLNQVRIGTWLDARGMHNSAFIFVQRRGRGDDAHAKESSFIYDP